jgi:hypothetical protein
VQHIKYDLGYQTAGTYVTVKLDRQANVWLIDSANYHRYAHDTQETGIGGRQGRSPATLRVPTAGHWYLAIDLGGAGGAIRHAVTVR